MSETEIELLKQLEQDIRRLEQNSQALQNQITAILSANLVTTTVLLTLMNSLYPGCADGQRLQTTLSSLKALQTSIKRRNAWKA
ncbi:hypothetical protein BST81_25375 [Leptolyngbya sp. 'hensonii']|uniref:hypothetical protein n=1 Tax=Leptolyngbya sp. 'hensonii' TaxID=1922337 RepID=UPI00094F866A|nr:hypothetical protein [Leptolyngbya sp. 'hensonii']OLP15609.1 hypothetical protein BST81_25375 [Leptolyngbya sp. 'hensonii']